jgi:hypothetical protein
MPKIDLTKYDDTKLINLLKDDKQANLIIEQEAGKRWETQKLETAKLQEQVKSLSTKFDTTGITKVSFNLDQSSIQNYPAFSQIFKNIEEIAPSLKDVLDGNFWVLDSSGQAVKCHHKFKIIKNQDGEMAFGVDNFVENEV